MEWIDMNTLLIILGIGAIIVELLVGAATGFDLLLIGTFTALGGIVGRATHNVSFAFITIFVLSFLYVFVGRGFIRQKLSIATKSTNIDNLLGKKGIVIRKIVKRRAGQVKIEGEIWRAVSEKDIDEGEEVVIQSVSGVTLKVQ